MDSFYIKHRSPYISDVEYRPTRPARYVTEFIVKETEIIVDTK